MQKIEITLPEAPLVLTCPNCTSLMRLVGSEPHPVHPATDLLTYTCTVCDDFHTVMAPLPAILPQR